MDSQQLTIARRLSLSSSQTQSTETLEQNNISMWPDTMHDITIT